MKKYISNIFKRNKYVSIEKINYIRRFESCTQEHNLSKSQGHYFLFKMYNYNICVNVGCSWWHSS